MIKGISALPARADVKGSGRQCSDQRRAGTAAVRQCHRCRSSVTGKASSAIRWPLRSCAAALACRGLRTFRSMLARRAVASGAVCRYQPSAITTAAAGLLLGLVAYTDASAGGLLLPVAAIAIEVVVVGWLRAVQGQLCRLNAVLITPPLVLQQAPLHLAALPEPEGQFARLNRLIRHAAASEPYFSSSASTSVHRYAQ